MQKEGKDEYIKVKWSNFDFSSTELIKLKPKVMLLSLAFSDESKNILKTTLQISAYENTNSYDITSYFLLYYGKFSVIFIMYRVL